MAVGNPIREVKKMFSDKEIKLLEEIKWWDWDINKILSNLDVILGNDVNELAKLK